MAYANKDVCVWTEGETPSAILEKRNKKTQTGENYFNSILFTITWR